MWGIEGGETAGLYGFGFSADQGLGVQFGDDAETVATKFQFPDLLECKIPRSDSEKIVSLKLVEANGSVIQNDGNVKFKYVNRTKKAL